MRRRAVPGRSTSTARATSSAASPRVAVTWVLSNLSTSKHSRSVTVDVVDVDGLVISSAVQYYKRSVF